MKFELLWDDKSYILGLPSSFVENEQQTGHIFSLYGYPCIVMQADEYIIVCSILKEGDASLIIDRHNRVLESIRKCEEKVSKPSYREYMWKQVGEAMPNLIEWFIVGLMFFSVLAGVLGLIFAVLCLVSFLAGHGLDIVKCLLIIAGFFSVSFAARFTAFWAEKTEDYYSRY